jgi:hypothetical protein
MSSLRTVQATSYEFGHLDGWRDASQLVLVAPPRTTFTPNIQAQHQELPDDVTFEEYMQIQREELAQLAGFRLLENGERELAGRPALKHSFSWDLPEHPGTRIRQLQFVCLRDAQVVTVTCSALEGDWDGVEPAFELAMSKFAWR